MSAYGHPSVMTVGAFMDMMDEVRKGTRATVTFKEGSPKKNTTGASYRPGVDTLDEALNSTPVTAPSILSDGLKAMQDRAAERDRECGERSMPACVNAFNALTGHKLTEEDGWLLLSVLKMSRSRGGNFRADDFVDGAAYMALAGEAAAGGR